MTGSTPRDVPDFGYEVDDQLNERTSVVFDARTEAAEEWLARAAAARCTGVSGEVTGRTLRVDPHECRVFLTAFDDAGLTVEGFSRVTAGRIESREPPMQA